MSNGRVSPSTEHPSRDKGLYAHALDVLGQEIIDGVLQPESVILADQTCERLGISRSVIRESFRTLSSMGLVESRPHSGTRILPPSRWDLLNPRVVRWRAKSSQYRLQMKQLLELRFGVEQASAALAASNATTASTLRMEVAVNEMREAFHAGASADFFAADAAFHREILEASGNPIISQLSEIISTAFDVRRFDHRPGTHELSLASVDRHAALARAIAAQDSEESQRAAALLVQATLAELEEL